MCKVGMGGIICSLNEAVGMYYKISGQVMVISWLNQISVCPHPPG